MKPADDAFYTAMLTLTSSREWEFLMDDLKAEVYNLQANGFEDAKDWGDLREMRGYAKALAYLINTRDRVVKLMDNQTENENADV